MKCRCGAKTVRQVMRFGGRYEEREVCKRCGLVCRVAVYTERDGWHLDYIEDRIKGKILTEVNAEGGSQD